MCRTIWYVICQWHKPRIWRCGFRFTETHQIYPHYSDRFILAGRPHMIVQQWMAIMLDAGTRPSFASSIWAIWVNFLNYVFLVSRKTRRSELNWTWNQLDSKLLYIINMWLGEVFSQRGGGECRYRRVRHQAGIRRRNPDLVAELPVEISPLQLQYQFDPKSI